MDRFKDQTVLVVGSVRSIGAAHARAYHAEGAFVVIGDVYDCDGYALAAELGERALFVHMDPASEDDWRMALRIAEQRFGPVSTVINSPGLSNRIDDDAVK
jgi:3alpha(or 20beta)-hydroxysteroid dehydrogenase